MTSRSRLLNKLNSRVGSDDSSKDSNIGDDSTQMGVSIQKLEAAESETKVTMQLDPNAIQRQWNSREIPMTFEEVRAIKWPSLDMDGELLEKGLIDIISRVQSNDNQLVARLKDNDWTNESLLSFFYDIHFLAKSILSEGQIHDISVYRSESDYTKYVLIAGECRLLAFVYGKAAGATMPSVRCLVHTEKPSPLDFALIQDRENTRKRELSFYQLLLSKRAVYKAFIEKKPIPTSRQAATLFSYKSNSFASTLLRLFKREDCEEILRIVKTRQLTKNDLVAVISELDNTGTEVIKERLVENVSLENNSVSKGNDNTHQRSDSQNRVATVVKKKSEEALLKEKAKSYGLAISKKTDLSLIHFFLGTLLNSKKVTKEDKVQIKECIGAEDPKQMLSTLVHLAQNLED